MESLGKSNKPRITRRGTGKRQADQILVDEDFMDEGQLNENESVLNNMKMHHAENLNGTIIYNPYEGKMSGFLAVMKEHSISMYVGGKAVKHRWHECNGDTFRWTKNFEEDYQSISWSGEIPLRDVQMVIPEAKCNSFSGEDKYAFEIVTSGRKFVVATNNEAERTNWVTALQAGAERFMPNRRATRFDNVNPIADIPANLSSNSSLNNDQSITMDRGSLVEALNTDILGSALSGFTAIEPHYTSDEYVVGITNLNDFAMTLDLAEVIPEVVAYPEYLSWREEKSSAASIEVEIHIPTVLTSYTCTNMDKPKITYKVVQSTFRVDQPIRAVMDFAKSKFTELGVPYAGDDKAADLMVLQVYGKQDFMLHRDLPIGFSDYMFRCARMSDKAKLNIRVLTEVERAALSKLIEESTMSFSCKYKKRYPSVLEDHYKVSREASSEALKSSTTASGYKDFVLLKNKTQNQLKIVVSTVRFPPIVDLKSFTRVRLEVSLVCGSEELTEEPMRVPMVTFTEQRDKSIVVHCDAVLYSNFPISDIPPETRVVVRLLGMEGKTRKDFLFAGANTMLFNHDLNMASTPFTLDLTHTQRTVDQQDSAGAGSGSPDRGGSKANDRSSSNGTGSSEGNSTDQKSPAAAAIQEAFAAKNQKNAVLLDDDGHEIPTFQALHLEACVPTAKDRRMAKRSTECIGGSGSGVESSSSDGAIGKARRGSTLARASAEFQANKTSIPDAADGGELGISSPSPVPMNLDESVLRVVDSVQVGMRFRLTKDENLPNNFVVHCPQSSLKHVLDHMAEEYGNTNDTETEEDRFDEEEFEHVESLIQDADDGTIDCLYAPSAEEKKLLWKYRHECAAHPKLLPKFLQSVDWTNPAERREAHHMLILWRLGSPIESIELLDHQYADSLVRNYAVHRISRLSDEDLQTVLLQLVQVLKYEPYHDSSLARFLIRRALISPLTIGQSLFWMLYSEMHLPIIEERFGLLLSLFLAKCGPYRDSLSQQLWINNRLKEVAQDLKLQPSKKARLLYARQKVESLNKLIENPFCTCLDPQVLCTQLIPDKCKVMESKKMPLWLVFENSEPCSDNYYTIFKDGDDLRQDQLTLQLIAFMDRQWRDEHLADPEAAFSTLFGSETHYRRSMLAKEEEEVERERTLTLNSMRSASPLENKARVASMEFLEGDIDNADKDDKVAGGGPSGDENDNSTPPSAAITAEKEKEGEGEADQPMPPPAPERGTDTPSAGDDSTKTEDKKEEEKEEEKPKEEEEAATDLGAEDGEKETARTSDGAAEPARERSNSQHKAEVEAATGKSGGGWGKLKGSLMTGKLFTTANENRMDAMLAACDNLELDLKMKPYGCVSTGYNTGMIQVVTSSKTLAGIQTEYGGKAMGAFSNTTMIEYLKEAHEDEEDYDLAVDNFQLTCAGYCVCTYLLGIGDRHADNIMIQDSGHFFHIDFGHFLGNFKSKYGLNRERSPFVFTPEMAEVIKLRFMKNRDKSAEEYEYGKISYHNPLTEFECICIKAFNVIRKKATLLMNLFILMIPACMPELTHRNDVAYLRHKLKFTLDDKEAGEKMVQKISQCLATTSRRIDNALHNLKHY